MSDNRPLSPHLQIYRPQLTSVLSIMHRLSGVILTVAMLVIIGWLASLAMGADSYHAVAAALNTWAGRALLGGWTLATSYHLLNGIRHLGWDCGVGFSLAQAYRSGFAVLIGTILLAVLPWLGR